MKFENNKNQRNRQVIVFAPIYFSELSAHSTHECSLWFACCITDVGVKQCTVTTLLELYVFFCSLVAGGVAFYQHIHIFSPLLVYNENKLGVTFFPPKYKITLPHRAGFTQNETPWS